MKLKIDEVAYHRNGVCGNGFHAVLFRFKPDGERREKSFLATVFDEPGNCAVISLDRISVYGVEFGPNSWRGDWFEDELRAAIKNTDAANAAVGQS